MSLTWWIVIGLFVLVWIIDWFIVMGPNPKKWKGGDKDEIDRTDRKV